MSDLASLLRRVKAATGPDRELDWSLHDVAFVEFFEQYGYRRKGEFYVTASPAVPGGERISAPEYYTASIDAALALVDKMLPGRFALNLHWLPDSLGFAYFGKRREYTHDEDWLPSLPLAILAALLTALIEKEKSDA